MFSPAISFCMVKAVDEMTVKCATFWWLKLPWNKMLVIIITWFVNMIIWGLLVSVKVKDLNLAHNH